MDPIPSGRLKNLKDVDKWASLSLYLPVRGMSVTCELVAVPVQSDGLNSALSPVVYGDIALTINTGTSHHLKFRAATSGISRRGTGV